MALARTLALVVQKLVEAGHLSTENAKTLFESEEEVAGAELDNLLHDKFKVGHFEILIAKSRAVGVPPVNLRRCEISETTFQIIDKDFCREQMVVPVSSFGNHLFVAIADPFNTVAISRIEQLSNLGVIRMLALESDVLAKLEKDKEVQRPEGFDDVMEGFAEEMGEEEEIEISDDDLEAESSPIVQLAARIIEDAYYAGGSDIHIEPGERDARIRVRVDGRCEEKLRIPNRVAGGLLARLKVMSNLDIAEKRIPQDGRIVYKQFNRRGLDVDLRISTAPLNHGEGCVMRILDKQKSTLPLTKLGFSDENLSRYRECITRPYGMILHCGPTGSGKSMTLYSALNEINSPDICIRTAEDPIEYTLPGLCQMQMHRKIGLTFAAALRAYLRQDPDVILVGEIRDQETAQIAVEAALTGHLLFSTLHTNDAATTISRLTEMDIEPFMISSSLVCVCSQRLMRRVCKTCRIPHEPDGREAEILEKGIGWVGPIMAPNHEGCPACNRGYKGRVGIHELMITDEDLTRAINAGYETAKVKLVAVRGGMKTLHQDSLLKVKEHTSTLEHALTTVPQDQEDLERVRNAETLELLFSA